HRHSMLYYHCRPPITTPDGVPSLKRRLKLAARGQSTGPAVKNIVAKDANTVVIQLASPVGLLTAYLANPNNIAAIMPRSVIEKFGDKPISTMIGTGPYKFQEWKPDAQTNLVRREEYVAANQQ